MKVILKSIGQAYNQHGCGQRLQFLIKYECRSPRKWKREQHSFTLNRRLNKLVEYWNYYGKDTRIEKTVIFTPFGSEDKNEGEVKGFEHYFQYDNKITNPVVEAKE